MRLVGIYGLASLLWAQTILVNGTGAGSFEGGTGCTGNSYTVDGWTIVNGTQTNRWAVNTGAGAQHGSRAIYITNNCGATPPPNSYTITSSSVVHFYRDVALPAGEPYMTISFYVKVEGEGTTTQYDYLDVLVAPTSVTPAAGTEVSSTYRLARYNLLGSSWVQRTVRFCGTGGQTYRVIFSWRNDASAGTQPPAAVDQVHITSSATPPPTPWIVNVSALPYSHGADNTCGKGNNLTSSNVSPTCGSTSYYGGEDMVWVFTPNSSGMVTITLNASTTYTGLKLYQGGTLNPCGGLTGATCVGEANSGSSTASNLTLTACVQPGQTYYLQVDYWPSPTCGAITNLTISAPTPPGACTGLGTGVTTVTALPYNSGAGTTCGAVDDITSSNAWSCGSSSYFTGEDRVWVFTPTTSGAVTITLTHSNASSPWFGLKVYEGCPRTSSCGVCVGSCESSSGPYSFNVNVTAGKTYYVVLDHYASPACASYDNLSISAPVSGGGGACGSPVLSSFPVITTGTTAGAPPLGVSPSCAVGGSCGGGGAVGRWYQFIPTASNMTIHVAPGTLTDPAVVVFSAPSCGGPFTEIACQQDGSNTGNDCESFPYYAHLDLTGLTVGQTYYIAVFGASGSGDYTLAIWETAAQPPSQFGQDCNAISGNPATGPLPVCSSTFSVGAPGFLGSGFTCDLPYPASGCPGSCLTSGERNIVWLRLPIASSGNLSFAITPAQNVDYDWTLYRIDNVSNPCQAIRNGTLQPVRCSYDAPTSCDGTYGTGVACGTPGCASGTCEGSSGQGWLQCLPVNAGEVYLLGISNFSTSTFPGFSVDFGTSPIDYGAASAGPAVWTGGGGTTAWNNNANWGGCAFPDNCAKDVVIYGGAANQPVIAAAETWTVQNITIPAGAKLTVNGTLNVCGHLTVNGELDGTGWIVFVGGAAYPVQEIRGVLTGPTQYIPNLRINRAAAGTVRLMTNVQVRGHVQIDNSANNTLNLNSYTLFVGGNFVNVGAAGTFTHGNGRVVFNGTGPQTYTDPGIDPFYTVEMNQNPPSTLTLNNRMDITNQLTLTSGVIVTGTNEVRVTNTATTAVTPGNTNSYVRGYLRRYIGGMGGYDFPVGTASYQRANVNFTAAPGVHNLLAWFNDWAPSPPTPPNPTAECGAQYHACPMLNNGYWTINAYNSSFAQVTSSGTYTMTLYNTAYTACAGAVQFGVLKNTGAGWFIQNPGCYANASAATVQRPGMSGFSNFGTGQSLTPLPVYLTRWEGEVRPDESHLLRWDVVAEETRVSRFVVETGAAPEALSPWRTFGPEVRQAVRENPPFGSSFYRLRIYTVEGAEFASSVIELQRGVGSINPLQSLEAFPNPTTGELTVRFMVGELTPVHLSLVNALGQRVWEKVVEPAAKGWVEVPVGPYLLRVEGEGVVRTRVVVRE